MNSGSSQGHPPADRVEDTSKFCQGTESAKKWAPASAISSAVCRQRTASFDSRRRSRATVLSPQPTAFAIRRSGQSGCCSICLRRFATTSRCARVATATAGPPSAGGGLPDDLGMDVIKGTAKGCRRRKGDAVPLGDHPRNPLPGQLVLRGAGPTPRRHTAGRAAVVDLPRPSAAAVSFCCRM